MTRYGMTKERAITLIESRCPQNPRKPWGVEYKNACKMAIMAIKVLEQQLCEDAISRQAVLDQTYLWSKDEFLRVTNPFDYLRKRINSLSPVTPQPKWIPVSERLPEQYKEVIVTDIETSDTYLSQYIGDGYWECDNGLFNNRIIAWQPLPEPYKAGSEK